MANLDWLDSLKTGDLLFFSGQTFISRVIEWSGHCPWSHVGMIVRFPAADSTEYQPLAGKLCLWESVNYWANTPSLSIESLRWKLLPIEHRQAITAQEKYDPESDRPGVRLVDLLERLASMEEHEKLGIARISISDLQLQKSVETSIRRYNGRPYEYHMGTLIRSWLDVFDGTRCCCSTFNQADLTAFFCSELIAQTLVNASVLHLTRPWEGMGSAGEVTVGDLARLSEKTSLLGSRIRYSKVELIIY